MFLERCPMYVERMWLQHINPLFASSREATSTKPFCFFGLIQDCVEPLYTQWTQTERVPFLAHVSRIILKRGNSVEGILALVLHHPAFTPRQSCIPFFFLIPAFLNVRFYTFYLAGKIPPRKINDRPSNVSPFTLRSVSPPLNPAFFLKGLRCKVWNKQPFDIKRLSAHGRTAKFCQRRLATSSSFLARLSSEFWRIAAGPHPVETSASCVPVLSADW